jgi:hypothetical protein
MCAASCRHRRGNYNSSYASAEPRKRRPLSGPRKEKDGRHGEEEDRDAENDKDENQLVFGHIDISTKQPGFRLGSAMGARDPVR